MRSNLALIGPEAAFARGADRPSGAGPGRPCRGLEWVGSGYRARCSPDPPLRPLQGLRARFAGQDLRFTAGWVYRYSPPYYPPGYPPRYTHPARYTLYTTVSAGHAQYARQCTNSCF